MESADILCRHPLRLSVPSLSGFLSGCPCCKDSCKGRIKTPVLRLRILQHSTAACLSERKRAWGTLHGQPDKKPWTERDRTGEEEAALIIR